MKNSGSCQQCAQLLKKIKVLTSDYDFQIKKLSQDKSTEKALYEVSLQKQYRKMQEKYQNEKDQHDLDNKKWMDKYDQTIKKTNIQIETLKKQKEKQILCIKGEVSSEMKKFKEQKQSQCHKKIIDTEKNANEQINALRQKLKEDVKRLKDNYEKDILQLKQSHEKAMDKKIKEMDCIIVGLKSSLKTQQQMHVKTKKTNDDKVASIYEEIYKKKKEIITLQEEKKELKTTIQSLKNEIQTLKQDHQQQLQQMNEDKAAIIADYEQQLKRINDEQLQLRKKQKQVWQQQCKVFSSAIEKIDDKRQQQIKIYQQNIESIKNFIDQRPSRIQDLQQIAQLKQTLNKKHKETGLILEELKWYKLQLSNKQQTYNRIFVSAGVNNSSTFNNQRNNQNSIAKKKQFKLRRAGKSVTTVRQILNTVNSGDLDRRHNLGALGGGYKGSKML